MKPLLFRQFLGYNFRTILSWEETIFVVGDPYKAQRFEKFELNWKVMGSLRGQICTCDDVIMKMHNFRQNLVTRCPVMRDKLSWHLI